ncbi:hypothetical protein [Acinetobacter sp.]|uniref:hypothetical protein n=1 Tax=Acinetobacter sp. TaxID=472 RepID=UPI0031D7D425
MSTHEVELSMRHPKILALHGNGSNKAITQLQLQNLDINEKYYELTCLNGTIQVNHP